MAGHLQRTQILLEPEQHAALAEIAAREGRSISDVVRDLIRERLAPRSPAGNTASERQLVALEPIQRHRAEILAESGGEPLAWDVVGDINQMREERAAESWAVLTGHRD